MQVQELGVLESPIALVNTFSVGVASMALIRDAMGQNPELGRTLPTLNPLVFECNDGWLNDARSMRLQTNHVMDALNSARSIQGSQLFLQGSVGAGRGMSCHGIKGGIGTASRRLLFQGQPYTLGRFGPGKSRSPQCLDFGGPSESVKLCRRWLPNGKVAQQKADRSVGQSSCYWPPTHRWTRASCNAWPVGLLWAWHAQDQTTATAAATLRLRFLPLTGFRSWRPSRCLTALCCTKARWICFFRLRPRQRTGHHFRPCFLPPRCGGATGTADSPSLTCWTVHQHRGQPTGRVKAPRTPGLSRY